MIYITIIYLDTQQFRTFKHQPPPKLHQCVFIYVYIYIHIDIHKHIHMRVREFINYVADMAINDNTNVEIKYLDVSHRDFF